MNALAHLQNPFVAAEIARIQRGVKLLPIICPGLDHIDKLHSLWGPYPALIADPSKILNAVAEDHEQFGPAPVIADAPGLRPIGDFLTNVLTKAAWRSISYWRGIADDESRPEEERRHAAHEAAAILKIAHKNGLLTVGT